MDRAKGNRRVLRALEIYIVTPASNKSALSFHHFVVVVKKYSCSNFPPGQGRIIDLDSASPLRGCHSTRPAICWIEQRAIAEQHQGLSLPLR